MKAALCLATAYQGGSRAESGGKENDPGYPKVRLKFNPNSEVGIGDSSSGILPE